MRRLKYFALAALLVLPVTACDEGTGAVEFVEGVIRGRVSIDGQGEGGIQVALSGTSTASTTTDANGDYQFSGLEGGTYTVTISGAPSDAQFATTSQTAAITQSGQTVTVDFSGQFIRTSSIVGSVTANGTGLGGVAVSLSGDESLSTTTGADGQYTFTGLRAGSYTVSIAGFDPNLYTFATTSQSASVATGQAQVVNFAGQEAETATLTATVTQDGAGLGGVTVEISGPTSQSMVTSGSGQAAFTGLPRGTYAVAISGFDAANVEFPGGTTGTVAIANIGGSGSITFAGQTVARSSIGGRAYKDLNKNGSYDGGTDEAIVGLTVTLSGAASNTTTTGADGTYTFASLAAGSYTVSITNPDPEAYIFDATSVSVTLASSASATANFRAIERRDGSITGQVWFDNGDGLFTSGSGDVPAANFSMTATGPDTKSVTTDANGMYAITDLPLGDYDLSCDDCNATFAPASPFAVTLSSTATSAVVDFVSNAGTGTIAGRLYIDENAENGQFDGPTLEDNLTVEGVTVTLEGPQVGDVQTTTTDANGEYSFGDLPPGVYGVTVDDAAPEIPGNVMFFGNATTSVAIGVGGQASVNWAFRITQQAVQVNTVLGYDQGETGDPVEGVLVDLYPTKVDAENLTNRIGQETTDATGFATFRFARSVDTSPQVGVRDGIVYSVVRTLPDAFHVIQADSVMEVAYPNKDSLHMALDSVDILNTQVTMQFNAMEIDGDTLAGWAAALWIADTTSAAIGGGQTDANGAISFTDAVGVGSLPVTYYMRLSNGQALANGHVFEQTPMPTDTGSVGQWLFFEHKGLVAAGTVVDVGDEAVKYLDFDLIAYMHHERDDSTGVTPLLSSGDDFVNVDNMEISYWEDIAGTVTLMGTQTPTAGTGQVTFNNIPTERMYYLSSRTTVAEQYALDDTIFAVDPAMGYMVDEPDGSDQTATVCPLANGLGCSTFAFKYVNGTVTGVVRAEDGTDANGIKVKIMADPMNIQPKWRHPTTNVVSDFADTTLTVAGGSYGFSFMGEGPFMVQVFDSVTASGDSIWAFLPDRPLAAGANPPPNKSDTIIDVEDANDSDIANFIPTRMDTKVLGVIVNDRDGDNQTLDPNEALGGAVVELWDSAAATMLAEDTTDTSGAFSFSKLREGQYVLQHRTGTPDASQRVLVDISTTTQVVRTQATNVGAGAQNTRTVGSNTPATLPLWDYDESKGNFVEPSHFTFLFANTTARGFVRDAAANPVAGVTVTLRRCDDSTGGSSPPQPGTCTSYAGLVVNAVTTSTGAFTFANIEEGIYEITPNPVTAGYTTSTPVSRLFKLVGTGDIEEGNYVVN